MSYWLTDLAWICLGTGFTCAIIIAIDLLAGHRQNMWIMNIVWPVTALYAGPLAFWAYYRIGRLSTKKTARAAMRQNQPPPGKQKPFPQIVAVATTHCGAGCTLGDLVAEWSVVLFPALGSLVFENKMFNAWIIDFIAAYVFGIAFQYFTIVPMRGLSPGRGLWAAVKADTLSLLAWQVGMYGWMAIAAFCLFHRELPKTTPVFWFMMQLAMIFGFLTSYPINWWLVSSGIKEKM